MTLTELLTDPVVRAALMLHSGRLSRMPVFTSWTRDDIIHELFVGLLQRLASYDANRGHVRSWATVAIRSAASTLMRDQRRKKRNLIRFAVSLHEPGRHGKTPLDHLRAGAGRSHVDALVDQATVGTVLSRLSPHLRDLCTVLGQVGFRGARKRSGLGQRAFAVQMDELREQFANGGYVDEAAAHSRARCASKRRGRRTSNGMGRSRPR